MVADIDSYSPFIQAVLVAHLRIVTYLTPFPTVVRGVTSGTGSVYQPVITA